MQIQLEKTSMGVRAFTKRTSSLRRKFSQHGTYFFDSENKEDPGAGQSVSLYEMATGMEEAGVFEGANNSLDFIASQINIGNKITAIEVFKIGELLVKAKKLCQQKKQGFKQWIERTFDFSYELANKQMNVFYNCLGWRAFATDIPVSILYRMGEPSFDCELREFLFTKGKITTISEFKGLVKRYREGGIEAIENEIEELNRYTYIYRQTQYILDQGRNCSIFLEGVLRNIENQLGTLPLPFEDKIKSNEPEAREVNQMTYAGIKDGTNVINNTTEAAREKFQAYMESVKMKMKMKM